MSDVGGEGRLGGHSGGRSFSLGEGPRGHELDHLDLPMLTGVADRQITGAARRLLPDGVDEVAELLGHGRRRVLWSVRYAREAAP